MKVLVIDAYNMLHRSRFGYGSGPHSITFNFFRSLRSEIERHDPHIVYIVLEGSPKHRFILNKDYKGNRTPVVDDNFHRQKKDIFDLCKSLPVKVIRHPEYECDDVIGYICTIRHSDDQTVIVSSDSDFIQLLENERVKLWNPIKKKYVSQWPVDYVMWKSLKGDPTDNIPGIKGIGEKRAFSLVANVSTLWEMLDRDEEKRRIYDSAYAQIKLAPIERDDPKIEEHTYKFNKTHVHDEFSNREFKSIVNNSMWKKWCTTLEKLNDAVESYVK
jgi:DNA polymerase-1